MSDEQRNEPPDRLSSDQVGGPSSGESEQTQQEPRPVGELRGFMATGAFAVPVPGDVESDGPPRQAPPPAGEPAPAGQRPPPPAEPPAVQQPRPPVEAGGAPQPPPAPPSSLPQPEPTSDRDQFDPFGRPWPDANAQPTHDPFGRPLHPAAPTAPSPGPDGLAAGDPLAGAPPGGLAAGDPLTADPPPGGGVAPPTEQQPAPFRQPPPDYEPRSAQWQGHAPGSVWPQEYELGSAPPLQAGYAYQEAPPGPGYSPAQAPPGVFPPATAAAAAPQASRYTLAGWWRRVGSAVIDFFLRVIAGALIGGIPAGVGIALANGDGTGMQVAGVVLAIIGYAIATTVLTFYAAFWMNRTNGQTIGDQALGIRVVRVDGQPMSLGYGLWREVVIKGLGLPIASIFTLGILFLLNWLWPLWDGENRAFHDMVAKTRVVET